MFKLDIKSDFDIKKLKQQAMSAAAKDIEQKCKRAAAPHGGVTVHIEHASDGTPKNVTFEGSEAAVEAAKRALA